MYSLMREREEDRRENERAAAVLCAQSNVAAPVCSAASLQSLQSSIKCGLGLFHRHGNAAVRHRKLPDKRHVRRPCSLFIFLISSLSGCWYGNPSINVISNALSNQGITEKFENGRVYYSWAITDRVVKIKSLLYPNVMEELHLKDLSVCIVY